MQLLPTAPAQAPSSFVAQIMGYFGAELCGTCPSLNNNRYWLPTEFVISKISIVLAGWAIAVRLPMGAKFKNRHIYSVGAWGIHTMQYG